MKKISTLILCVLFVAFATAQTNTWEHLPNFNGNYFKKCSMFNNGTAKGFAIITNSIGITSIVKTNDGGQNWSAPLNLPSNISDILDLAFYNELLGFISVRINSTPFLETKIYKTINGGVSWIDVSPNDLAVGTGIADIYMLPNNANQVFHVCGDKYHVSTDAGLTWNSYTFGGYYPSCVSFSDSLHGIVGAWDGTFLYSGAIYTTNNGGLSWDSILLPSAYSQIKSVISQSATEYAALSDGEPFSSSAPKLYYSTNAAATWDTIPLLFLDSIPASPIQIIDGTSGNEVFILSNAPGNIYYSASPNGNFSLNYTNDTTFTCMCKAGNQLYAFGNNGLAVRSTLDLTGNTFLKSNLSELSVYPNPAHTSTRVTLPKNNCELELFNAVGKLVYAQKVNGTLFNLELPIDKGIYLLRARDGNQFWQTKLVVK